MGTAIKRKPLLTTTFLVLFFTIMVNAQERINREKLAIKAESKEIHNVNGYQYNEIIGEWESIIFSEEISNLKLLKINFNAKDYYVLTCTRTSGFYVYFDGYVFEKIFPYLKNDTSLVLKSLLHEVTSDIPMLEGGDNPIRTLIDQIHTKLLKKEYDIKYFTIKRTNNSIRFNKPSYEIESLENKHYEISIDDFGNLIKLKDISN